MHRPPCVRTSDMADVCAAIEAARPQPVFVFVDEGRGAPSVWQCLTVEDVCRAFALSGSMAAPFSVSADEVDLLDARSFRLDEMFRVLSEPLPKCNAAKEAARYDQ